MNELVQCQLFVFFINIFIFCAFFFFRFSSLWLVVEFAVHFSRVSPSSCRFIFISYTDRRGYCTWIHLNDLIECTFFYISFFGFSFYTLFFYFILQPTSEYIFNALWVIVRCNVGQQPSLFISCNEGIFYNPLFYVLHSTGCSRSLWFFCSLCCLLIGSHSRFYFYSFLFLFFLWGGVEVIKSRKDFWQLWL